MQAAFATHNCGEYGGWVAMLVYAYAQGGVTESGIVATVMLIPAAVFAPVDGRCWRSASRSGRRCSPAYARAGA